MFLRAVVRHFQADGFTIPAGDQLSFNRLHEVFDLLAFDIQVAVAGYAELIAALDLHPGEQFVHKRMDDRGQKHEVIAAGIGQRRVQTDQPWQGSRCLHDCTLAGAAKCVNALESDEKVQALVEDSGKWPRRIKCCRAEYRLDLAVKIAAQPFAMFRAPSRPADEADPGCFECGDQLPVQQAVLFVDKLVRTLTDVVQYLACAQHVRPLGREPKLLALTQTADTNFEELVQVCRNNTEKLQSLEQRDRRIFDLMQDTLVEFERAEFPIDEVFGQFEVWRVQQKQPADPAKTIAGRERRRALHSSHLS